MCPAGYLWETELALLYELNTGNKEPDDNSRQKQLLVDLDSMTVVKEVLLWRNDQPTY